MRAVCVTSLDGPSGLQVVDVEAPRPTRARTLVEVRAVAPAFPDLLLSQGKYQIKPDLPFSPGSDFAGVVIQPAEGSPYTAGDRVAGCLSFGAAAEELSVPDDRLYPLPEEMSFMDAAALPMNYLTAHFALVTRGNLRSGESVMVLGASGGVGLASVQVAAGLGAHVIAVVSSEERRPLVADAGAHDVVLRDEVPERPRALTHGRGVDMVIDVVGGDVRKALQTLAPCGRLMTVGFASGEIPTVKLNRLLLTNTDIRGVESDYLWREGISQEAWTVLLDLAAAGYIRPVVRHGGSLEAYGSALEALSTRSVVGRIVLSV